MTETNRKPSQKSSGIRVARIIGFVGLGLFVLGIALFLISNPSWGRDESLLGLKNSLMVLSLGLIPAGFVVSLLALQVLLSSLVADLAKSKGGSWDAFFWLSIFFLVIMWIVAVAMSPLPGSPRFVTQPPASNPSSDSADQIQKLAQLRDQGILTSKEFEAKKKEMLDRM